MPNNELTIVIDGENYTGWSSAVVRRSMSMLCGAFDVSMVDYDGGIISKIKPNTPCEIFLGSEKILNGYLDTFDPAVTAESSSVASSGRDRTGDLVDCSAIYKTGTWTGNVDLLTICKNLCDPFNIKVTANTDLGADFTNFALNQGETVFEAISRACKARGILPLSDGKGDLVLVSAGSERTTDALMMGQNVKEASAGWKYENRFSEYRVKGQRTTQGEGWDSSTVAIEGVAKDLNMPRYRPKIISADGITTIADAQKQAAWEMSVAYGKSNSVSVTVPGWFQSSGKLWKENLIAYTVIPALNVDADLLVTEIVYSQDSDEGSLTTMILNPPEIFAADPALTRKKKSRSEAWGGWD